MFLGGLAGIPLENEPKLITSGYSRCIARSYMTLDYRFVERKLVLFPVKKTWKRLNIEGPALSWNPIKPGAVGSQDYTFSLNNQQIPAT